MKHYCLECGWAASTEEGYTGSQLSRKTIDHFVETGHSIESDTRLDGGAVDGGPAPGSRTPGL